MKCILRKRTNIVITGGSKGLGRALAREFVSRGDNVLITSRNRKDVRKAMIEIKEEAKYLPNYKYGGKVYGVECDISDLKSVGYLSKSAQFLFHKIDGWICNAGQSGNYGFFLEKSPVIYQDVIQTNLYGTMICTQQACRIFSRQKSGSLFYVDGGGSDYQPTPYYTVYGATKAAIRHLWETMKVENKTIPIHILSPGMVLTPLLLKQTDISLLAPAFNILCEHPEIPAAFLTTKAKLLIDNKKTSHTYIKYLCHIQLFIRIVTLPFKKNRHFDESNGLKLYSDSFDVRIKSNKNQIVQERQRILF